ncbi:crcB integral membrane protein, partial [Rhodococcus opacus PD630]
VFLWAALGGAIGSSLRYFVGKMMPSKFLMFESFPLGTFSVNVIGCFVIGFMGHLAAKKVFGNDFGIFFVTGGFRGFYDLFFLWVRHFKTFAKIPIP